MLQSCLKHTTQYLFEFSKKSQRYRKSLKQVFQKSSAKVPGRAVVAMVVAAVVVAVAVRCAKQRLAVFGSLLCLSLIRSNKLYKKTKHAQRAK